MTTRRLGFLDDPPSRIPEDTQSPGTLEEGDPQVGVPLWSDSVFNAGDQVVFWPGRSVEGWRYDKEWSYGIALVPGHSYRVNNTFSNSMYVPWLGRWETRPSIHLENGSYYLSGLFVPESYVVRASRPNFQIGERLVFRFRAGGVHSWGEAPTLTPGETYTVNEDERRDTRVDCINRTLDVVWILVEGLGEFPYASEHFCRDPARFAAGQTVVLRPTRDLVTDEDWGLAPRLVAGATLEVRRPPRWTTSGGYQGDWFQCAENMYWYDVAHFALESECMGSVLAFSPNSAAASSSDSVTTRASLDLLMGVYTDRMKRAPSDFPEGLQVVFDPLGEGTTWYGAVREDQKPSRGQVLTITHTQSSTLHEDPWIRLKDGNKDYNYHYSRYFRPATENDILQHDLASAPAIGEYVVCTGHSMDDYGCDPPEIGQIYEVKEKVIGSFGRRMPILWIVLEKGPSYTLGCTLGFPAEDFRRATDEERENHMNNETTSDATGRHFSVLNTADNTTTSECALLETAIRQAREFATSHPGVKFEIVKRVRSFYLPPSELVETEL